MEAGSTSTPFRAFSPAEFCETPTWHRLARILTGNGGAYGIYGPRGSGKSWLMLRAINQTDADGGMGLWFPCPSNYDTSAFLSTLSDNLASMVERRFVRNDTRSLFWRQAQPLLGVAVVGLLLSQVITSALRGGLASASRFFGDTLWGWIVLAVALALFGLMTVDQVRRARQPAAQLAREAISLRERIRYTTGLRAGSEVNVSGGTRITGSLKQTREKSLDERPTTIASLVFDFRRLAQLIIDTTRKPLVIGIDELDKIDDSQEARRLLRDIKGIFEISGVYFLVSVSAEAATALQLGALRGKGLDEFNSSFYTVLELPSQSPDEIAAVLRGRGVHVDSEIATMLCLLSEGNWREMIRLAENLPRGGDKTPRFQLAALTLTAERAALQREIIRVYADGEAGDLLPAAWRALPAAAFESPGEFDALSRSAIHDHWNLANDDPTWRDAISGPWRRILVRLFVVGQAVGGRPMSTAEICDLRDVLIMAGHSTSVALLMLQARFGDDLARPYVGLAKVTTITGVSSR